MRDTGKNVKTLFDLDPSSIISLYRINLKGKGGVPVSCRGEWLHAASYL